MVTKGLWTWCALIGLAGGTVGAEAAGWKLDVAGKDADWLKRTAQVRELLGKLNPADPLTVRYAPNVTRHVEMIQREKSFDWKRVTAIEFLENMLTDLLAGKDPHLRYAGKGVAVAYWSELMDRIEAIWVHVPPSYDPAKEYQIVMCYKCGGGIHYKDGKAAGGYRPTAEVANQTDTFFAWSSLYYGVKGRMGAADELREAMPAITGEFPISPDRVFLTGWSDGGFTDVWLGSYYPHLVAGILPNCANWQYSNVSQVGLANVPFRVVDGWSDGGYVQRNINRWHVLRSMGYPVSVIMGHHGHARAPYENVEEMKRLLAWAKTQRRDLWPKHVRYATWNLTWHQAYWVQIERMIEPVLAAQIDVQVAPGNRIDVAAQNVGAYRLSLSDKLVEPAKPVTVTTNGKPSYAGPFQADLLINVTDPPAGAFAKTPQTPGGIGARIVHSYYGLKRDGGFRMTGRRWLTVKPTGGDEEVRKLLAAWGPDYGKADSEVTDADMAQYNLFLLGGPEVNQLTARIAGKLPVRFERGRFTVGEKVYDRPENCVKFIHPNPLHPAKYVIVYAFNDAKTFAAGKFRVSDDRGGKVELANESAYRFRDGDCLVYNVPAAPRKWGVDVGASATRIDRSIFDAAWRPASRAVLGELKAPVDTAQLLRLRADAAKEATGADVGIVFSYTPSWNRWGTSIPAGPVTVHELGTLDMFPEYLTIAEVTGAQLYGMQTDRGRERVTGLLAGASASSVLDRRDDPAYEAGKTLAVEDIDPKKTYRVAMGYRGMPAYGAEPKQMPPLFEFATPEEFLAGGHTSLPFRNPRQTTVQMTEAVAGYIARRKSVTVRPTCFDLTSYIMNPQANHFGAMDWLHLGADASWPGPGRTKVARRYTLSLGLRAADGPELAPPRENSKVFLDNNFAAAGTTARVDFATMGLKLPVQGELKTRALPAGEGVSAVVVDIRLTNRCEKDIVAEAVLAPMAMQRVNPGYWPDPGRWPKDKPQPYFRGFQDAVGTRGQPPVHEDAALFAVAEGSPSLAKLVAPSVGFNAGLVGLQRSIPIKAGQTVSVPLVLISVNATKDKPNPLTGVMETLKAEVLKGTP
ncbi:MAG TPA: 5'-nucleotidase C-terminal domain-containing protein [Phycisphaerae bacterium]|nr:5'-nucleotidase C-terminal domain-containing protein [Phycisphaerae bacterium]